MKQIVKNLLGIILFTFAASSHAVSVGKDLITQGAIHDFGDAGPGEFYGSGPDDGFEEYGIAGFSFDATDFGGPAGSLNSVTLSLTHNDRFFSDGDSVEFFFTPDTFASLASYSGLTYDSNTTNGIDASQYTTAPTSVGVFAYTPQAGGTVDDFDLDFSGAAGNALMEAINAGADFQIIIAATSLTHDVTYSGLNNSFDPGNPRLTIDANPVPVPAAAWFLGSGILGLLLRKRGQAVTHKG